MSVETSSCVEDATADPPGMEYFDDALRHAYEYPLVERPRPGAWRLVRDGEFAWVGQEAYDATCIPVPFYPGARLASAEAIEQEFGVDLSARYVVLDRSEGAGSAERPLADRAVFDNLCAGYGAGQGGRARYAPGRWWMHAPGPLGPLGYAFGALERLATPIFAFRSMTALVRRGGDLRDRARWRAYWVALREAAGAQLHGMDVGPRGLTLTDVRLPQGELSADGDSLNDAFIALLNAAWTLLGPRWFRARDRLGLTLGEAPVPPQHFGDLLRHERRALRGGAPPARAPCPHHPPHAPPRQCDDKDCPLYTLPPPGMRLERLLAA